jgi:hypothetical protein
VVNYYLKRKSDVYVVTLDASSAFDRVNVFGLLTKLIDRNVPFYVIRVLLSWFVKTNACVRLNGVCTDFMDVNSGVKQGGIMSPILYNVYVDDLMNKLLKENLGCTIGGISYGAIFYADDIVLMGSSVKKVQKMLDICCKYGNECGITFNPKKSKWYCTNHYSDCCFVTFMLNNDIITHDRECIYYLGVKLLMKRGVLVVDVGDRIKKFNSCAYDVLLNSNDLSEIVRCEIIVKKCLPVLLYGLGYGELMHDDVYKLHVAYRKVYRYIFKMSLRSHISELLNVFGVRPISDLINEKRCNFLYRNLTSRFHEIIFLTYCVILDV